MTSESTPENPEKPLTLLRLGNQGETFLALEVLGYEFPEMTAEMRMYDGNWLNIRISAHIPAVGGWKVVCPCLQIHELERLGDWLGQAIDTGAAPPEPEFLEPDLAFELDWDAGAGDWSFIVRLASSAVAAAPRSVGEVGIDLAVTDSGLQEICDNIRAILTIWPSRSRLLI